MASKSEELFEHWEAIIACIGDIVSRKVAEEREASAKLAEAEIELIKSLLPDDQPDAQTACRDIATAIRKRGQ